MSIVNGFECRLKAPISTSLPPPPLPLPPPSSPFAAPFRLFRIRSTDATTRITINTTAPTAIPMATPRTDVGGPAEGEPGEPGELGDAPPPLVPAPPPSWLFDPGVPPPPPPVPPEELSLHTVSVAVLHTYLTPLAQAALVVHGVQGSLPVPENDVPPMHVATAPVHTMSAPGTHAVLTPVGHVDAVAHGWHGALPDEDHVEPSSHAGAALQTVFFCVVQVVLTPCVHVAAAAQSEHGATPDEDQVLPAPVPPVHGTLHTRSFVATHADLDPEPPHAETAVHAVHGSLPDTENDVPPTQGATAPVQTMSAPGTQAVLTPVGGAVLNLLSQVYGRVVLMHLFDAPAGGLPAVKASAHTVLPPTQATYQLSPFAGALGVIFAVPLQALLSLHLSTTFSARPVTSKSWQASDP